MSEMPERHKNAFKMLNGIADEVLGTPTRRPRGPRIKYNWFYTFSKYRRVGFIKVNGRYDIVERINSNKVVVIGTTNILADVMEKMKARKAEIG